MTLLKRNLELLYATNTRLKGKIDENQISQHCFTPQEVENIETKFLGDYLSTLDKRVVKHATFFPRNTRSIDDWSETYGSKYAEEKVVPLEFSEYYRLHDDIHAYRSMSSIARILADIGYDPTDTISMACKNIHTLIAFGTGSGIELKSLIRTFQPRNLIVIVSDWNEFTSSFSYLDWEQLWQLFTSDTRLPRIHLVRSESENQTFIECCHFGILSLNHAHVYIADNISSKLRMWSDALFGSRVGNSVIYTGYTVDEYNMLINTVQTLRASERMFSTSVTLPLCDHAIVCASGPSLDNSISILSEASKSSLVVCGGSSIRSLLKHGIRVDVLCLMERDHEVYDAYYQLAQELDLSSTTVVMSTTCDPRIPALFPRSVLFFRPALSPLSIFCRDPQEILPCEGPEAINTAFSFVCQLGIPNITLFGCDLGSALAERDRSVDAAAFTHRHWDRKVPGNLSPEVFTNKAMLDVAEVLTACADMYGQNATIRNASDGVMIKGIDPIHPTDISTLLTTNQSPPVSLVEWYRRLPAILTSRTYSSWRAAAIRKECESLCNDLLTLFAQSTVSTIYETSESLCNILQLDGSINEQYPKRVVRSTLFKAFLTVMQQYEIMRKSAEGNAQFIQFYDRSLAVMRNVTIAVRREVFDLCDTIENELLRAS